MLGHSLNIDAMGWWVRVSGAGVSHGYSLLFLAHDFDAVAFVQVTDDGVLAVGVADDGNGYLAFFAGLRSVGAFGAEHDDSGLSVTGVERR